MKLSFLSQQAQISLANYERYLDEEGKGRNLTIITLNNDGLHIQAGNRKVIEIFGSLFKTQCLKCGEVLENRKQPIWPSLAGRGWVRLLEFNVLHYHQLLTYTDRLAKASLFLSHIT